MPKTKQKYVIIRARDAGAFAGYLLSNNPVDSVVLRSARRLWYWSGAASLSQLAQEGTSKPKECKFPVAVDQQVVNGVIEILDVTAIAQASIEGVPVWRA